MGAYYRSRGEKRYKPEAQAKASPSLALQASVNLARAQFAI
jgi:hypothetical protein